MISRILPYHLGMAVMIVSLWPMADPGTERPWGGAPVRKRQRVEKWSGNVEP